jgi:ABC-type lipoprotein export system ATPase subunit
VTTRVELKNVCRSFQGPEGEIRALNGISLTVAAGELVAVRGPSGCGKTTLLLVTGGLLRPTGGTVRLNGEDLYGLDPARRAVVRRSAVGFVFQQFHLLPYLTVVENILAPSVALPREGAKQRAQDLVDRFGLRSRARHVPAQLSTGERQRAALARALLNSPDVILADEPTGNLDRENAGLIADYLREFSEQGGAVLLVTHDDRVLPSASRVLNMRGGELAAV